jgi:hypothetical protein
VNNLQRWTIAGCALSVCSTSRLASAQQTNAIPPVRQLGPQVAVSSGFGSVAAIRPLSDGRVLVADAGKRRLVLLDSTLSHEVVVADSTPTTNKAFGSSRAGLLRYAGDSTLFIDANAIALLLIDPSGHIVRTMAPPRPEDLASLVVAAGPAGTATFSRGGLVYPLLAMTLTNGVIDFAAPASPKPGGAVGSATDLTAPPKRDSQFIVRADIQTRRTDTIGFVAVPPLPLPVRHTAADGSVVATTTTNPIELIDGWAVVADGSVAFVRA